MATLTKSIAAWPTPMVPVYELMMGTACTGCGTAREMQWMIDSGIFVKGEITLGRIISQEPLAYDQRRDERRRAA